MALKMEILKNTQVEKCGIREWDEGGESSIDRPNINLVWTKKKFFERDWFEKTSF